MRERCLQSLAILLAGLFSAERARERARDERNRAAGALPADPKLAPPNAQPLKN